MFFVLSFMCFQSDEKKWSRYARPGTRSCQGTRCSLLRSQCFYLLRGKWGFREFNTSCPHCTSTAEILDDQSEESPTSTSSGTILSAQTDTTRSVSSGKHLRGKHEDSLDSTSAHRCHAHRRQHQLRCTQVSAGCSLTSLPQIVLHGAGSRVDTQEFQRVQHGNSQSILWPVIMYLHNLILIVLQVSTFGEATVGDFNDDTECLIRTDQIKPAK